MSYKKISEMLAGNISFLSTQIAPWIAQYGCKSAFDLFNHDFKGDTDEKVKIMGYIHRRDAYIQILNTLEYEATSIREETKSTRLKTIPISRKWEIIENAFTRKTGKVMGEMGIEDSEILNGLDPQTWRESKLVLAEAIQNGSFEHAIPLFAALWYNANVEPLGPAVPQPEPTSPLIA
jgi:hypothetical protein